MAEKISLIPVLDQIERDKGIKRDEILRLIESSLVSAYRKQYGRNINVVAKVNPESAEVGVFVVKKVVESVVNDSEEISLEETKNLKLKAKMGEEVQIPTQTEEFSRIAAQIAKQVIIQKIREVERAAIFEEFSGRENQLASGSVLRFAERNIILDLGKAEGILPVREQVRRERFIIGDRLRVLVLKVERGARIPQILVSRSHPDLVRRQLEMEIPEVKDKIIEILAVVRDPGFRSKVAVKSHNPQIDPVGTCVGVRGTRIRPIIDELRGEKIDLIPYHPEVTKYIAAALSPAKVLAVNLKEAEKSAEVLVSDDMFNLAVGKNGQNARLASQLTGWNINVMSESQKKQESAKNQDAAQKNLARMEGVGPKIAEVLIKGGWTSAEKIAQATKEELMTLQGIGEKTAEKLMDSAKEVVRKQEEEAASLPTPAGKQAEGKDSSADGKDLDAEKTDNEKES